MSDLRRILIVDDDTETCDALRDVLELFDFHAECAGTATDALAHPALAEVSAILLDRHLPDGTAEQWIEKFKAAAPGAEIVVVTGHADLDSSLAALRLGAADYLLKPVNPDALRLALDRIMQQKRLERDKSATEARLRLLDAAIADLDEGVVVTDAELEWPGPKILFSNVAMSQITGYTMDEMLGQTPRMFQGPATDRRRLKRLKQKLAAGESFVGENINYRKDGTQFFVELRISPVLDRRGQLSHYVSTHRDVTERKRAEERLVQTERLAAIGTAMAGLAHESRNALQRSQACLEMLARRVAHLPKATELIQRIQVAQDDLHRLYEDVREFARPIKLSPERYDLGRLVTESWERLDHKRRGRSACLELDPQALDLHCEVDKFGIQQVFRNILDNALAACEDPVKICVGFADARLDRRPALRVAVRDNGPGLTAETRSRIFEEFFTTKTHGTGLGMAICKRLVQAHEGQITTGEGPGAEILVTLPRKLS